jgi:hypothetical protein
MVKKAVQAASARGASSSSIIHIQISDIDADFGDSDPLTLLQRFKVSHCCFLSAIVSQKMTTFFRVFADIRRCFLQPCSKTHPSSHNVPQRGEQQPKLFLFNSVSSAQCHNLMSNNC